MMKPQYRANNTSHNPNSVYGQLMENPMEKLWIAMENYGAIMEELWSHTWEKTWSPCGIGVGEIN